MLYYPPRLFLSFAGTLLAVGVLTVYSASVTSRPTDFEQVYLLRQMTAAALGLCLALAASLVPVEWWKKWSPWLFGVVLLLLIAVLIPGVGTRVKGARRWLRMGGVSVQPSELAKIAVPMLTCLWLAAAHRTGRMGWSHSIWVLVPTLLVLPLVLLEPDLGTSCFLALGTLLALYLGGWPWQRFVLGMVLLLPASGGLLFLKPYQWERIHGLLAAWKDLDAAPYQVRQSLVTLGAGGWTGTGLGRGWQKLSFLPEANTDFVFSVIGEELGLWGTLGLVAVWSGLFVCGMRMLTRHDPRSFSFLAGTTLLTQLVTQAILNVAVATALVPPKGIAHPLISAGGSNLVVSLVTLGIVYGLAQGPADPSSAPRAEEKSPCS